MPVMTTVAACLCVLLALQPATPPQDARDRVELGLGPDDGLLSAQDVELTLAAQLFDAQLDAHVAPLGSGDLLDRIAWAEAQVEPDVLAVFFTERVGEGRRLYLLEPRTGGLWVRELPRTQDDDLLLESLGAMVRGISTALRDGPPRGMTEVTRPSVPEPEPPKPEPEPEPQPEPEVATPRPRPHLSVTAAYLGGMLARSRPWQSGGVIGLGVELPVHVVLGVRVGLFAPAPVKGPPALQLWRVPVRLHGAYRFRPNADLRPELGVGLVVGTMAWRPGDGDADDGGRPGEAVRVALAPQAGLSWRLAGGFGLHMNTMLDVWVSNADLVVEVGTARRSQLRPFVLTAALEAGAHYTF